MLDLDKRTNKFAMAVGTDLYEGFVPEFERPCRMNINPALEIAPEHLGDSSFLFAASCLIGQSKLVPRPAP